MVDGGMVDGRMDVWMERWTMEGWMMGDRWVC